MEVFEEITDVISDAFDDMDMIGCNTVGLYNYIMDCNEHFMEKRYIPERLCYAAVFQAEAQNRKISLNEEQIKAGNDAVAVLKQEYPQYFESFEKWNHQ